MNRQLNRITETLVIQKQVISLQRHAKQRQSNKSDRVGTKYV